jgi:hypothetical protein
MKIEAYLNLTWWSDKIHTMPGESEDTMSRLKNRLKLCSKIKGLKEMHIVYGPLAAIAKAETESMEELSVVINEIERVFPIKDCMTYVVQPQLRPEEQSEDSRFT